MTATHPRENANKRKHALFSKPETHTPRKPFSYPSTNLEIVQRGVVVRCQVHRSRPGVVKVREGHPVLRSNLVSDDDLVDVVELVPILLIPIHVAEQGLELRPSRHGDVESLGGEERLFIEQVPVVPVQRTRKSRGCSLSGLYHHAFMKTLLCECFEDVHRVTTRWAMDKLNSVCCPRVKNTEVRGVSSISGTQGGGGQRQLLIEYGEGLS